MAVSESRVYHVGIVVPELEPAMRELTETTGVTWGRIQRDIPTRFGTPDGPRVWNVTFVYSKEAPYIELLQQLDDSIWAEVGFHHIGLWSDDVHADSTALEGRGGAWQCAMTDDTGERLGGCYHLLTAAHCRVEFASVERSRPRLERYLAGGDYM